MNTNLFLPSDRVKIPELDAEGIVIRVTMTFYGTCYMVRYFHEGSPCECEFFDFEIKAVNRENAKQP